MTVETTPESPGTAAPEVPEPAASVTPDLDPEAGLATAEYAIATIAAAGFAGLLILVLQSDTVRGMLESIISSALTV
ncbi:DUF4244 domain-containing protein [Isoptericola sp. b408]|uniref:DUF4244 domain-containing protein n=1 Tax=Isoptericola sp. b408 TaxID=3064653 RepID=UPI0027142056|nr:DUF4244 domain-containing protein [Isoptericola sp. b408]MDO8150443.1 DUF4244 domain-containing protein [Isoptericola sp. b408]